MNADNNPAPLADSDDASTVQIDLPAVDLPTVAPIELPVTPIIQPIISSDVWHLRPPITSTLTLPEDGFASVQALRDWLVESIDQEFGHLFGTTSSGLTWSWYPSIELDTVVLSGAIQTFSDAAVPRSQQVNAASTTFSETNVQVEGVDEADLIETDGRYVYLVTGAELLIIDTLDPENLEITSRVQLDEAPTGMYLSVDRLTLISERTSTGNYSDDIGLIWTNEIYPGSSSNPQTTVTVLDLSDRAAPTQVQQTVLTGRLVSSRMVDGQLRLVLSHQLGHKGIHLPSLVTTSTIDEETNQTLYTYESRADYLDRVVDDMLDVLLSTYRTYSVDDEVLSEEHLVDPNDLITDGTSGPLHKTTIVTFDVLADEAGPTDTKTIFTGGATAVYSTQDSLYVFGPTFGPMRDFSWHSQKTNIWKFDIDPEDHSIQRSARGQVEGALLNQFSIDEHDGYLRIVTSQSPWNSGHTLEILQQVGNRLETVGSVERIAPGEVLYSVRFMEDRAYAVTFRMIDPLFAIDLSDPTDPQVMGELKIPGYSDYLQPLDDNHLLGIGRGANESNGMFEELQISIFDVSDLSDPQLAHRYSFEGGRSTATIATGNRWQRGDGDHHAVSYFESEQILAIPVYNAEDESRRWLETENTPLFGAGEGGLQVFSVDTEMGFEPLALIEHDTPILRSLRIGESLLAFSSGEISTHDIADPTQELDSLPLLVGSGVGLVQLSDYEVIAEQQAAPHVVAVALSESKKTVSERSPLLPTVVDPSTRKNVAREVTEKTTDQTVLPILQVTEPAFSPTIKPDTFVASLFHDLSSRLQLGQNQGILGDYASEITQGPYLSFNTSLTQQAQTNDGVFSLIGAEEEEHDLPSVELTLDDDLFTLADDCEMPIRI